MLWNLGRNVKQLVRNVELGAMIEDKVRHQLYLGCATTGDNWPAAMKEEGQETWRKWKCKGSHWRQ